MSDLIKKLEAFRANLVGEDMNYRACLVDEGISRIRVLEAKCETLEALVYALSHTDAEVLRAANLAGDCEHG